jgi:hypothetical protein
VKESLSTVLTGMYHHRVDYPAPATAPARAPEPVAALREPSVSER